VHCNITPNNSFFLNGGLLAYSSVPKLLILVFDARRIPPRRAGACNTFKEPAGGLWGILNKKITTEEGSSHWCPHSQWSGARTKSAIRPTLHAAMNSAFVDDNATVGWNLHL
jgi:hypothetical protein